jgi:S-adenosylmethionine hydrolase
MVYDWISFTTDYGLSDGFTAACRGVIAGIAPDVGVMDVTHDVPPQRIRQAASVLADTLPFLPKCVHLAVVDPGVGSRRRGVVVVALRGLLVGPDNGLLLPAAEALGGVQAAYELTEPAYQLPHVSATFHGRDIFAPAAAHLALGVAPEAFGKPVSDLVELPTPLHVISTRPKGLIVGVLATDHYGNIQLAATMDDLREAGLGKLVEIHGYDPEPTVTAIVGRTFSDVGPGGPILYEDSSGHLAIAVNYGSAVEMFGAETDEFTITASSKRW